MGILQSILDYFDLRLTTEDLRRKANPTVEPFVPQNPLTPQQFEERMRALTLTRTSSGESLSSEVYQDREFLLMVDFKLGKDFSEGKRKLLLEAHQAMRQQRNKIIKDYLAYSFLPFSANRHMKKINDLLQRLLVVFESILSPGEFRTFTGCGSAREGYPIRDLEGTDDV
jgi:hypothetical protein